MSLVFFPLLRGNQGAKYLHASNLLNNFKDILEKSSLNFNTIVADSRNASVHAHVMRSIKRESGD